MIRVKTTQFYTSNEQEVLPTKYCEWFPRTFLQAAKSLFLDNMVLHYHVLEKVTKVGWPHSLAVP
jgi:hypothetical protein